MIDNPVCKSSKLPDIYPRKERLLDHHFIPYIYILFFFTVFEGLHAQHTKLHIEVQSMTDEAQFIGQYDQKDFTHTDSIETAIGRFMEKMELSGYLNARLDSLTQTDSLYTAYINPGKRTTHLLLHHERYPHKLVDDRSLRQLAAIQNDSTISIRFSNLRPFMNALVALFEKKGNSFVQFSLRDIVLNGELASARLVMQMDFQRHIDKIIVKGYENFPTNFITHELGLKKGSVFNKDKIERASRAINGLAFARELKPPEILFTNDSTIVYLYLEKKKSNEFDGIIGFASDENGEGLSFNGYLDLSMNNIFNSGETIALFWKNNGEDRQRFYLGAEFPFLFNLPLTPAGNLELYRQDSTFNNIRAQFSLRYNMSRKGEIAAQFSSENSNDLSSGTQNDVVSYSNTFYGLRYHYRQLSSDVLFPVKFSIDLSAQAGSRKTDTENMDQSKFTLNANYLYPINLKNFIFLQNFSGWLISDDYFENELFRIGGIFNLRGVNEESIFTSAYTVFNLEYRFAPNTTSYFYSITDYAYFENNLALTNNNVFSVGLGYAFRTKAGLLNISYALGKFDDTPFTFENSKIHVKIISRF